MKTVGIDVGSTTVKAVLVEDGRELWKDYRRHGTRQAASVLSFLEQMEEHHGLKAGRDRLLLTGSGAGLIAPLLGVRVVQEVVAVAAAVEALHPDVRFVSEIGGEDMKTLFFGEHEGKRTKQVFMQSACSGGTGTFIEKSAGKLRIGSDELCRMHHAGLAIHKISSKCGIFAEADANTLLKAGVPKAEIIASLFDAVVSQSLATMTKGNTPMPKVLLLGGPNCFFEGLQEAWRHHLWEFWKERGIEITGDPDTLVQVPDQALYFACLGCIELATREGGQAPAYQGRDKLEQWIETGQHADKLSSGKPGLAGTADEMEAFMARYKPDAGRRANAFHAAQERAAPGHYVLGLDLGSTTSKAAVLSDSNDVIFTDYAKSVGNPIEDARILLRKVGEAGFADPAALALTGYGKDLLTDILAADVAVVETVAHAEAALHYFPGADVICDVGGCDVKIMLLRDGMVVDFRLNSQCSSGNGAFLEGVAERYDVALEDYAERAFAARTMPELVMGCGVFLQSDIVNQQRRGWSSEEIMAALASVLPVNVWVYAGQLHNMAALGRNFVLQGGTHRNLAVVKAQVEFIRDKVPGANISVHPYPGEAGAIGAALFAGNHAAAGLPSRFCGSAAVEALEYQTTTNSDTICHWCTNICQRTFIDVAVKNAPGRPWSKVPLEADRQRVISGNACPKGLVEDTGELRAVKSEMEGKKREFPNAADLVRERAFRGLLTQG